MEASGIFSRLTCEPHSWVGALLVTLLVLGCEQAPTSPSPSTTELTPEPVPYEASFQTQVRPRIVAFGNSLTAGLGVPPDDTYPAQLQRRLDQLGYTYDVVNAGVSGETTAGGLRRVSWVLRSNPAVVILELGGNDGLRGLSLDQTRANLNEIILRLKEKHVQVVLAGMKLPPNYGPEYTSRFETMYHELARTHDLTLIPFFLEGVGGDRSLNQADGIHPTGDGYGVVVDHVVNALQPILGPPVP